jgi:hypothetical protein
MYRCTRAYEFVIFFWELTAGEAPTAHEFVIATCFSKPVKNWEDGELLKTALVY